MATRRYLPIIQDVQKKRVRLAEAQMVACALNQRERKGGASYFKMRYEGLGMSSNSYTYEVFFGSTGSLRIVKPHSDDKAIAMTGEEVEALMCQLEGDME